MEKVYRLEHDFKYLGKISFVKNQSGAIYLPYNQSGQLSYEMSSVIESELPKEIYFGFDFKLVKKSDYIINDILINIFSRKILEILMNIGEIKCKIVPVIMFNHQELEAYHIEEGIGFEDLKQKNEDYVALQLTEFTEAFDYENSMYEMHGLFEEEVGYIDKLVLKTPINGFPPIFKIKEEITELFITEEAKLALEQAGIKGCKFEEVEVSS